MSSKELHNAQLRYNPNVREVFLDQQSESFDNDLTCQFSEIIKTNNLVKRFLSSGMEPNAKDLQHLVFCIKAYYDNGKKRQAFCFRSFI